MDVRNKLLDYLKLNNIPAERVAKEVDISMEKLSREGKAELSADELCAICAFLHVNPYEFYDRKLYGGIIKRMESE